MSALDRTRAPEPGPLRPFRFPAVERAALANGLGIMVARSGGLPLVTVELLIDAGGAHDADEAGGVASLAASLLESGTTSRTAEEIALIVDELGISLDVGATWDGVTVGFTGLREFMEPAFALIADLVRNPSFPPSEVERLREERLGSLTHRRADPAGLASEVLHRYVFEEGSPYGRPLGGTRASIAALDPERVAAFHHRRYGSGGSWVAAAGDVSLPEVAELAGRFLGDWSAAPDPSPLPPADPGVSGTTMVVAHRPGAVQSEVRVGHVGVARTAPDFPAVQVMNAVLGGTFSSRLNLNLRERLGYTYGASSSFVARRVPGVFTMGAAVQTEATAHSVAEMLREMREMQAAPPTPREVDDARSYLAGVIPLTLETTGGVAARLAAAAIYGLPDGYWDEYRAALLAVDPERAHAAAREHLMPGQAVVVVVADADQVRAPLEALAEGPVQVIDADSVLG